MKPHMKPQDWLTLGAWLCVIGCLLMFGGFPDKTFIVSSIGIGAFGSGFIAYVLGLKMKGGSYVLFKDRNS